ncbi:MAG: methyltransferase domain-containing protein [Prevotellaceae bacterium]|jgi:SAM-dependent methyltransferase|nr:methyltransferase domain-containing protein [Prevotellaceae bacterium]
MKLKYLKELFGYRQSYGCGDYLCSPLPADTEEKTDDVRIPFSKYDIPFDFVNINKGTTVVNIISNMGYEILQASEKTGTDGKVIGIDFSPAMMYKARYNVEKTGCRNVFFREVFSPKFLPLGANISDTLIFNNLLNRIPIDNLFSEIYRTLKPGGVFYIYVIISEYLIRELYACGFKNIVINKFFEDGSNSESKQLNTALIRGEK